MEKKKNKKKIFSKWGRRDKMIREGDVKIKNKGV